ncbi:l-lysine 6-monooxygenase [Moniliophthora roreri]|nr:l-lysine 6-monooxygenase [Moniliophthora roreri]
MTGQVSVPPSHMCNLLKLRHKEILHRVWHNTVPKADIIDHFTSANTHYTKESIAQAMGRLLNTLNIDSWLELRFACCCSVRQQLVIP